MKAVSNMSKILRHSYILLAGLVLLLVGLPGSAVAVEPLDALVVDFENTPLFDEANFLPGDGVARYVKVTNNTDEAKDIVVEAINTSDPDGLGDVLVVEITEGETTLYTDTLAAFFEAGEITLSELAGEGTETEYDFTVSFEEESGDTYQGKSVGFDILIGFLGEGGGGEGGGGEGGGGGGISVPSGLVIKDELVRVTNIGETSVTVEWPTSHLSTSQVIYSAEGETHALDLSDNTGTPPTYGYAHTTAEFDTSPKVTAHSVLVTGLAPGTTYFFRAVSHASPPSITREYTFETLSLREIGGVSPEQDERLVQAGEGVVDDEGARISGTEGELSEIVGEPFDSAQGKEEISLTRGLNVFTAGIGLFLDSLDTPFLIVVALIILFLLFFIFFRKRKKGSMADRD